MIGHFNQLLDRLPFERWRRLWGSSTPEPIQQAARIRSVERDIGLIVKAAVLVLLAYYLFFGIRVEDITATRQVAFPEAPVQRWALMMEAVQVFFLVYVVVNVVGAILLVLMDRLPLKLIVWLIFTLGIIDGLFVACLTLVTGGFDSILYWMILGLIVRNAISVPLAPLQIAMNLMVSLWYVLAGLLDVAWTNFEGTIYLEMETIAPAEPFILRLIVLLLMTVTCYGLQMLHDKEERASEEAREFALRQQQLQAAGRLAGEIAHQLKNPLGIINNAAFTLQRTVKEGKSTITQQIQIIREEVERSDRIISELMGYARLTEGKVERIDVVEELEAAIERVFPKAVKYAVELERHYAAALPPLLVQRSHLSAVFINLLQNAREAMNGSGKIRVSVQFGSSYSVVFKLRDAGPGIPAETLPKIFEPYFTTKEKGTGLGLAIVKHNVELYGGTVRVESKVGEGTEFTLEFPARTLINLRK